MANFSSNKPLTFEDIHEVLEKIRDFENPNRHELVMSKEMQKVLKVFINTHGGKI